MKKVRIHLSRPFEETLAAVLSLPKVSPEDYADADELKQLVRGLHEAANGRQVETPFGLVPIAPPVAPFLKEAPFEVETQLDFLVEAMSRVIACPSDPADTAGLSQMNGSAHGRSGPVRANVAAKEPQFSFRVIPSTDRSHLPPQGISHG